MTSLQSLNVVVERGFSSRGTFVATWRKLCSSGVVLVALLLSLGLLKFEKKTDLFYLWIEDDSRLIKEREFLAEYTDNADSRTVAAVLTKGGQNMATKDSLEQLELFFTTIRDEITYTLPDDVPYSAWAGKSFTWKDVCTRVELPSVIKALSSYDSKSQLYEDLANGVENDPQRLSKLLLRGAPCSSISALHCFEEGGFDFDVGGLLGAILPDRWTGSFGIPPYMPTTDYERQRYRQSYKDLTEDEILEVLTQGCGTYLDEESKVASEGVYIGDLERDVDGRLTKVGSLQALTGLMNEEKLAQRLAEEDCETYESCRHNCGSEAADCILYADFFTDPANAAENIFNNPGCILSATTCSFTQDVQCVVQSCPEDGLQPIVVKEFTECMKTPYSEPTEKSCLTAQVTAQCPSGTDPTCPTEEVTKCVDFFLDNDQAGVTAWCNGVDYTIAMAQCKAATEACIGGIFTQNPNLLAFCAASSVATGAQCSIESNLCLQTLIAGTFEFSSSLDVTSSYTNVVAASGFCYTGLDTFLEFLRLSWTQECMQDGLNPLGSGDGCSPCAQACLDRSMDCALFNIDSSCEASTQACLSSSPRLFGKNTIDCALDVCLGFSDPSTPSCEDNCETECSPREDDFAERVATATMILEGWELELTKSLGQFNDADFSSSIFTGRSIDDVSDEMAETGETLLLAGWLAMLFFTAAVYFRPMRPVDSRASLGFAGVFIVALSVFTSVGLFSLFGGKSTPSVLSVLPFLALGLGVDDMFLLLEAFPYDPEKTVVEMTAQCLKEAGPSVTMTSITNLIAFLIGSSFSLPAVSTFSVAAAIVVVVSWFTIQFGFVAFLALDAERRLAGRYDVLCCKIDGDSSKVEKNETDKCSSKIANAAMSVPGKIVSLIASVVLISVCAYGTTLLEIGNPYEDIVPEDNPLYNFIRDNQKHRDYTVDLICDMAEQNVASSAIEVLKAMENAQASVERVSETSHVHERWPAAWVMWLNTDTHWHGMLQTLSIDYPPGFSEFPGFDAFFTEEVWETYLEPRDGYQFLHSSNERRLPGGDAYEYYSDQILSIFLVSPWPIQGFSYAGSFIFNSDQTCRAFTSFFWFSNMRSADHWIAAIKDLRVIVDEQIPYCFIGGLQVNLNDQYLSVETNLILGLTYVFIGAFISAFLFLYNPIAVFMAIGTIAISTFEIYGLLHWSGLQLNGVCILNLILAVAVLDEFTSHVTRSFMVATGTLDERATKALTELLYPVTMGAISTFVGVLFLAFTPFPYFSLYYFQMYVIILAVGWFNGLIFLPVLLSFAGPKSLTIESKSTSSVEQETQETIEIA